MMKFDYSRIKDPGYFAENRVPAHSDHICYASTEELAAQQTSLRLSLNGPWKFHYALNIGQAPEGFEQPDFDIDGWADIAVPAHVQMEGYGVPQYCNTQYPWDGYEALEPGELPKDFNPVMSYVKRFYLPEHFAGKRVFVSLQGAESCVAVWLNGHYVGFTSDSFTPHDFELTPYLNEGENRLACRLVRFSAGSWAEDQDFMRFSGLYREVFLYAAGEGHIADVRVKTLLDDACTDAVLDVTARIEGDDPAALALKLTDACGKTVATHNIENVTGAAHAAIPVAAPRLWSSEDPCLYTLTLVTRGADGAVLEATSVKVGFRRFEIRGGQMLVNGVRVVFKGVNRHDYCAETGRVVPDWKYRRDLVTMKRLNINAVRTSHYPNASLLYQLCDELGLYVIDENNMETHGVWERVARGEKPLSFALPGDREDWKAIMLDRVNSTYQRDKNHPCVVIWSCGNESLGGQVIYEMAQLFRSLDDTRPVHYEGVDHDPRLPDTTDIVSQMYTPVKRIREILSQRRDKPFILCEYTHSMGNSNGAMHWYTEYAYEEPLYQGGFIWDYLDQSVRGKDRYGQTAFHYGGDNGEMPHDGNFCGNGILYGDGEPSEKCQEVKYNYQNIVVEVSEGELLVKNRSMFTNTDAYDCVLLLARNGEPVAETVLATHIPPRQGMSAKVRAAQGGHGHQQHRRTRRPLHRAVRQAGGRPDRLSIRRGGYDPRHADAQFLAGAHGQRPGQSDAPALRPVEAGLDVRHQPAGSGRRLPEFRRARHLQRRRLGLPALCLRAAHVPRGAVRDDLHRPSQRQGPREAGARPRGGPERNAGIRRDVHAERRFRPAALLRPGPG